MFQVRVYDMTDGNGFRMLHHIDVDKTLKQIKHSTTKMNDVVEKGQTSDYLLFGYGTLYLNFKYNRQMFQ